MTVTFDLEYDEAQVLLCRLKAALTPSVPAADPLVSLIEDISEAINAEEERGWTQHYERLMESGGPDDSAYRRDMKDAGRGHLLR